MGTLNFPPQALLMHSRSGLELQIKHETGTPHTWSAPFCDLINLQDFSMDHLVRMHVRSPLRRSDARDAVGQILNGCIRLMATGPMPSVEKIAFESGTTTSSVYRHFAAKNDIFIAAVQYVLSTHRARILGIISQTSIDFQSSANFANTLFESTETQKPLLKNLIDSLSETDLSVALGRHRDIVADQLFDLLEKRFGAALVVERRTRIEITYNTMEHILLEHLKSPPCPIRQETFCLLFKSCANVFLTNFRMPSEASAISSMNLKQRESAEQTRS
jgi:AcrR family transcriptional regulator